MEMIEVIAASVGVVIFTTSVLIMIAGFFPRFCEQESLIVERTPGRALFIGLVPAFFVGTIMLTLGALGQNVAEIFFIPALIFLALLTAAVLFGLVGLARLLGRRLWPDQRPVRQLIYSGSLLALSMLTPFVGWFGFLPLLAVISLGLCVMALAQRFQSGRPAGSEEEKAISESS